MQAEALARAVQGQSLANYPAIIAGFMERGIPANEILPRENVFTFQAWKKLGRHVKKGEKGVRVATLREMSKRVRNDDGQLEDKLYTVPWSATVFHVSQTCCIETCTCRTFQEEKQ
jgi:antirestriction protein ArdC